MISRKELREHMLYDSEAGTFSRAKAVSNAKVGDVMGCINTDGYRVIQVCGFRYKAHQFAWLYMTGIWPNREIDHRNRVKDDNRWGNLRLSNRLLNLQNQGRAHSNNLLGFLGVSKNHKGFKATINASKKKHYLGTYKTPELAHEAYLDAKKMFHPHAMIDETLAKRATV